MRNKFLLDKMFPFSFFFFSMNFSFLLIFLNDYLICYFIFEWQGKLEKLKELGHIAGEENKLHFLNNQFVSLFL